MPNRTIQNIAEDIMREWEKPYFGAVPYLHAMLTLSGKNDLFGYDTASEIVLRFLANASSFRGPIAKQLKTELKNIIK